MPVCYTRFKTQTASLSEQHRSRVRFHQHNRAVPALIFISSWSIQAKDGEIFLWAFLLVLAQCHSLSWAI